MSKIINLVMKASTGAGFFVSSSPISSIDTMATLWLCSWMRSLCIYPTLHARKLKYTVSQNAHLDSAKVRTERCKTQHT